jgi:hypothetical protein
MRMTLTVAFVMGATLAATTFTAMAQETAVYEETTPQEETTAPQQETTAPQEETATQEGTLVFVPAQSVTVDGTNVVNEPPGVTLRCTGAPFVFEQVEGGTCVYEQTGSPTDVTCEVPTTLTANVFGLSVPFTAVECGVQSPERRPPPPEQQPSPEQSGEANSPPEASPKGS